MRRSLLLALCTLLFIAEWAALVPFLRTHRPTLVSGTVVDLMSGKPVPHATIVLRINWNGATGPEEFADEHGRFLIRGIPPGYYVSVLQAKHPSYSGLLGFSPGADIFLGKGDFLRNVTVPIVPLAEISGRILDQNNRPVSGCPISVIASKFLGPPTPASATTVAFANTDLQGRYRIANLQADRYYLLAQCDRRLPGESLNDPLSRRGWFGPRKSWLHVFYPASRSMQAATAITILPGMAKTGIDFHLQLVDTFSVIGTITRVGGEKPDPWGYYMNDFTFEQKNEPGEWYLAAEQFCASNVKQSRFRCDFVPRGSYRFSIFVSPTMRERAARLPPQTATLNLTVGARPPPPLNVQLQFARGPSALPATAPAPGTGSITLSVAVSENRYAFPPRLWVLGPDGREFSSLHHSLLNASRYHLDHLAPGTYTILALEPAFRRLRDKMWELMKQRATKVTIHSGEHKEIALHAFTSQEMFQIAMEYLRRSSDARF